MNDTIPARAGRREWIALAPAAIRRYYVGSRAALEAMIRAIDVHRLRPVISATFPLAEAHEAYRHLTSGQPVGKIVISG